MRNKGNVGHSSSKTHINSRLIRRAFRHIRKGSYSLSSASAVRYSELKLSESRHLMSYSRLPSARNLYRFMDFKDKPLRAVLNTPAGKSTNLTFILPRSRKGSYLSGKKLNASRFFVSLSKKMNLESPQNKLKSMLRAVIDKRRPVYSSRYFVDLSTWERLVNEELTLRSSKRHINKLRRLNKSNKPTFFQTNLSPSAYLDSEMLKSVPYSRDFSHSWWGRPNFFISISKGFIVRYLEDSYLGVKDSLSRLIESWALTYRKFLHLSGGALRAYQSEPQLAHFLYHTWLSRWLSVMNLYSSFTLFPQTDLYYKIHSAKRKVIEHILRFRFNKSRLHVILEDSKNHHTHFFTTPGLFIRYFQGKKSLKKNKALKYLMARFLRKMLLVLNLESVGLITKGVPVNLDKLLTAIFKPLSHPFTNPLTGEIINESDLTSPRKKEKGNIGISSVTFFAPKPFSYQKTRKRGRIKRKIQRRLVRMNKVID